MRGGIGKRAGFFSSWGNRQDNSRKTAGTTTGEIFLRALMNLYHWFQSVCENMPSWSSKPLDRIGVYLLA
jgi:hypothetical protein